jgi:hypothetical protein
MRIFGVMPTMRFKVFNDVIKTEKRCRVAALLIIRQQVNPKKPITEMFTGLSAGQLTP